MIKMNIQINKDSANIQNINHQHNYNYNVGTAFVSVADCKEEKIYESIKDSLYYPAGYLDKTISTIEMEHSILIQGEQGFGKSMLSFKIAEQMKKRNLITSAYYLNPPGDWNAIKQWIQAIHFQEKISQSEGIHLWIIDNLHKIPDAIEDFPDSSTWRADYCICCTRNLNSIPHENDVYYKMPLSQNQIFRLNIDEKIFLECYNTLAVNKIGRHESDYLYKCIGGNLAVLRYIITNGNLPSSLTDWKKEQFIDFHNIYSNYFGFGSANKIILENLYDTLKMLFLSQIDFSIPFYLQCNVCQTVLKDFYFEIANKELEIEHASLAELLTVCICKEYKLDYSIVFTDCLHWVLSNLVNSRHDKQEQIRQTNRFLQSLYSYKFVLNQNQALYEILSYDECITEFLEINVCFISTSTWKIITEITEKNSEINEVFRRVATSLQFIDAMCLNCDYDFQFIKDRLSQVELEEVEKHILPHAMKIKESIVSNGNEVSLMHLLLSLSEEAAIKFIVQIPSCDLVKLLSDNSDGLCLFARYYSCLGDDVKNILGTKISADNYRHIFINGASINGFGRLLASATDLLRRELCGLLTDDLIDRLIKNTIEKNYSINTLHMSLRQLKKESVDAFAAFEGAIGVGGYEELLQSQGTILILARLIGYSSEGMRKEMSRLLQSRPELVKSLVERTIMEGSSIGTLALSLRELKRESPDALEAFEDAIGVGGYEELLQSQGTISILARLIWHSSAEMQKKMSRLLQSKPELVKSLVERTINKGSSIGTLYLSLRGLKKKSPEALAAFEGAIGVKGYEELLQAQGTILILANLIWCSSAEMQKKISRLLQSKPELVKSLVERTINKGSSIGTLNIPIKALSMKNYSCLQTLENLIGLDGYLAMFSKCNTNTITILRIMACSSLSDSLVDIIYANIDVWNESRNYISETSCTIMNDFNSDLYYARKMDRTKFFDFIKGSVSIEEWLDWIRRGATLDEAVLIIRNLPLDIARQIANAWLQNYNVIIEGIRFVEQQRDNKRTIDSQIVNRAIISIGNYNQQLSDLISKEYSMPLSSLDSEL